MYSEEGQLSETVKEVLPSQFLIWKMTLMDILRTSQAFVSTAFITTPR